MNFKSIELPGFGKFQNCKIPFKPGLNVIIGQNESGKTTLFQAIIGTIFGFKTDRNRYLPWKNPGQYQAKLSIETHSHNVALERNFLDDKVTLREQEKTAGEITTYQGKVAPSGRSSEREVYLKKIHNIFGFSEPDIFKSSLFIEQRSLHKLPEVHTATQLKQLISNISEFRYDEIIQELEKKYYDITKKNPRGVDKRNDRLLENVQKKIQDLEGRTQKAHEDQKKLLEIGKKISGIREKLARKEHIRKKLNESITALRKLIHHVEEEERVDASFSEVKKKKNLVEKLLLQKSEIDQERPALNRLLIGSIFFSILAFPFLYFSTPIHWTWLILTFGGLVAMGIYHSITHRKESAMYDLKEVRLKSQLEVLPELNKLQTEHKELQTKLRNLEARSIELEKEIIDLDWSPGTIKTPQLTTLISEQEADLDSLSYELRAFQSSHQIEKQNYLYLSKGLESPFTLEEDLFDYREKEKNLRLKAQALMTAKEMLKEIVLDFRREHLKLFSDHTKEYFEKIVPAQYTGLTFNETNLAPSLRASENEMAQDGVFQSMSCGTQDQLFFAMRLALIDLLNPTRKLPLFLDDPFVNFDYNRRKKALDLLVQCSKDRQIFLFTFDPWYLEELQDEANIIRMEDHVVGHA